MEAKEILEGNKLICEFMGKAHRMWDERLLMVAEKENEYELISSGYWNHCSYYWSWDWLMPVVNKCFDNTTEEDRAFKGLVLFELGLFTPIEEIWKEVVEFIKWHNKQNKK